MTNLILPPDYHYYILRYPSIKVRYRHNSTTTILKTSPLSEKYLILDGV